MKDTLNVPFHTPSPMRCSTPLKDSQSSLLPVNPVLVVGPSAKGFLCPAVCQIYGRNFPPVGFIQSRMAFLLIHVPSIRSCYMKRDFSCFDPHSNWNNWCLRLQQFSIFWWVVLIDYSCSRSPLYCLYSKTKPSAMCATDVTRMRSCMSYRKLLNCKDVLEHYFENYCPLCFCFIRVWGKRWNFTHLFGCCTTHSMSLSLRCWSFDLIFVGSWRLKEHWAHTSWQIFL